MNNNDEFIVAIVETTSGAQMFLVSDFDSYDWTNFAYNTTEVSKELAEAYKQHLEWQLELVNRFLGAKEIENE